jgi:hypothetical protein
MTQITITRKLLREWNACYCDEEIKHYVPENGLTPTQILDLDIPVKDRLWVILREKIIPARELRMLACKWAREALAFAGNPDPRYVAAVDCSERFARGEATTEDLAAAEAAAWAATGAATEAAAEAAAWAATEAAAEAAAEAAVGAAVGDAAGAAAWAAAESAVGAAVGDVAEAAAWAAAWAAAEAAQINDCRTVLTSIAI